MARMIDKQETPGASDRAEDAPSLISSPISERPKKATQQWTESQLQRTPPKPPPRLRKRKTEFLIYDVGDLATPPSTQIEAQPSQRPIQEDTQWTTNARALEQEFEASISVLGICANSSESCLDSSGSRMFRT